MAWGPWPWASPRVWCVLRPYQASFLIATRHVQHVRTYVRVYSVHCSSRRIRPNGHLGSCWSQLEQNKLRDDDNIAKSLG